MYTFDEFLNDLLEKGRVKTKRVGEYDTLS